MERRLRMSVIGGLTILGLAGAGCSEKAGQKSPSVTSSPESGLGRTPTQILTPRETASKFPDTPEKQFAALVEFFNTSQEGMSKEAAETTNDLTLTCHSEIFPLKPKDKKLYFPELAGLSSLGSEIIEVKEGNTDFKFGICDMIMLGTKEDSKEATIPILIVFVGDKPPLILPTFRLKYEDLTDKMKLRIPLEEGESIEYVLAVPPITPEGEVDWPDSEMIGERMSTTISSDGDLRLVADGLELQKKNPYQDELYIPALAAIRQTDGTIRYEITNPIEDSEFFPTKNGFGEFLPAEKVINIQAEADGGFANFEVHQWQNMPGEVIEGEQFYNVFHVVNNDGTEYLLAARVGKTSEEALADPDSQLAQAKLDNEENWVWEKVELSFYLSEFLEGLKTA